MGSVICVFISQFILFFLTGKAIENTHVINWYILEFRIQCARKLLFIQYSQYSNRSEAYKRINESSVCFLLR